jgi:Rod binding domain-containing protein
LADNLSVSSALRTASAANALTRGASAVPKLAKGDAAEQFEAFVLQSFIQEMLPKEAEGVFGSGLSGDVWKSMLAEKLGAEVSERGGLGIADQIRGGGGTRARVESEALRISSGASSSLLDLIPDDHAGELASGVAPSTAGAMGVSMGSKGRY